MKHSIYYLALLIFLFACSPKSDKVIGNIREIPNVTVTSTTSAVPDTLFNFSSPGLTFYQTGKNVQAVQLVGVEHEETAARVSRRTEGSYNWFWDLYLGRFGDGTNLNLALEIDKGSFPKLKVDLGSIVEVVEPRFFLNQHLFQQGFRNIVVCDGRPHNDNFFSIMVTGDQLFGQRGGELKTAVDGSNFPQPVFVKYPNLTPADIQWLKTVWFPNVYQGEEKFEEQVYTAIQKGCIGIVGVGHAFKMYKKYGVKTVLITSDQQLHFAVMRNAIEEHYVSVIAGKK